MSELGGVLQSLYASYRAGEYFQAELGIREALKRWPNNADALKLGALTALELNQVVTAHHRLDQAIASTEMTAEIANIQGRILKASGDWAAAEEAYELAERLDPKLDRAKINRLNLYMVSEQPIRVLETLDSGFDFGDVSELARGQALCDLGRYDEALAALNLCTAEKHADKVLYQRMKCHAALGQLDSLTRGLSDLAENSSLYPKALNLVVDSQKMRGKREEALGYIEAAAKSKIPSVVIMTTRLRRRFDQDDKAQSELDHLGKQYPDDITVLSELAHSARLAGRADESCELYKRALSLKPGDFGIMSGFVQAAISARRQGEAQTVLQAALAQEPNNQFLLALVATLLRQMKQDHTRLYNYDAFVRAYDLEPPKGYENISAFNKALKAKLGELHVYQNAPLNQSLRGGSQTELDLSLIDDPVLRAFFNAVDAPIRDYMKGLGQNAGHPLQRRNRNAYRISGAWSVRLSENGHHVNHVHPMGWLSSAYYVDVPPSVNADSREGWIKFGEPALDIDQEAEHFVQPKSGRLVLFPSYMWHGTVPFRGTATRLTLPFDVVPA